MRTQSCLGDENSDALIPDFTWIMRNNLLVLNSLSHPS